MLQLRIISSTGTVYEGNVMHATFPGEIGSFAVYNLHAPIISTLVKGNIVCYPASGDPLTIPLESGFVEVKDNVITACIE